MIDFIIDFIIDLGFKIQNSIIILLISLSEHLL